MPRFVVTYEIVTPDSAEDGEAADHGVETEDVTLKDAIRACHIYDGRGAFMDCGRWFATHAALDYRTCEETSYALHPPRTITPASYARLARVLTERRRRATA